MKTIEIEGTLRKVGTKEAKKLRAAGKVPCILYGGKENIHFSLDTVKVNKFIYTPEVYQAKITIDGNSYNAVIQETQFHPVTDNTSHVDFIQLFDDKPTTVSLPVVLNGNPIGVRNGGKLSLPNRKLKVKALPSALPDNITLDVENLKIGESIKVKEVSIDGAEILDAPENVIIAVKTSRKAVDVEDEEETEGEGEEAAATEEAAPAEA